MSPHLEELMLTGQVADAQIIRCHSPQRPYLVTLWGPGHRKLAEAYGDRPIEALRNALGRLLTVAPPYPMPPGL